MLRFSIFLFFLFVSQKGFCANENYSMITENAKGKLIAESSISLSDLNSQLVVGTGEFLDVANASWNIKSSFIQLNSFLQPTLTNVSVLDNSKISVYDFSINYNQQTSKIEYHNKISAKTISWDFKGFTTDTFSMLNSLRFLAAEAAIDGKEKNFYLITPEPKLFFMRLYFLKKIEVFIDGKKIWANVFRIIPEIGVASDILKKILPDFFVCYSSENPYSWVYYEGAENSGKSRKIVFKSKSFISLSLSNQL